MPYQRFQEVTHKATALEAENARLQAQLVGHTQSMQVEVQSQVAKVRAEQGLRVGLARAGVVSDEYADYLVGQYQGLGPQAPAPDAWITSRKAATPAFFGGLAAPSTPAALVAPPAPVAGAPPVAPTPPAPPVDRGNPNAGTTGAPANPPTQDPPLTLELIEAMDTPTYARRRAEIRKFLAEQRR